MLQVFVIHETTLKQKTIFVGAASMTDQGKGF
jgi:hypothetical protein